MTGTTFPCPWDELSTCSDAGGSYWPPIIAGVVFVWWLGYRFGRFGGGRRR